MLNSGIICIAATYMAAGFDWPLIYIADSDDLPLINSGQSNFKFEYIVEFKTEF
jgi:hypothetical protein